MLAMPFLVVIKGGYFVSTTVYTVGNIRDELRDYLDEQLIISALTPEGADYGSITEEVTNAVDYGDLT